MYVGQVMEDHHVLHVAVDTNQGDMCRTLIDYGADVNAWTTDTDAETPLHIAARSHVGVDIVKMLIDNGAVVDAQTSVNKITPLHIVVKVDEAYSNVFDYKYSLTKHYTPSKEDFPDIT